MLAAIAEFEWVILLLLVLAYRPVARDLSRRRPPARAFL